MEAGMVTKQQPCIGNFSGFHLEGVDSSVGPWRALFVSGAGKILVLPRLRKALLNPAGEILRRVRLQCGHQFVFGIAGLLVLQQCDG